MFLYSNFNCRSFEFIRIQQNITSAYTTHVFCFTYSLLLIITFFSSIILLLVINTHMDIQLFGCYMSPAICGQNNKSVCAV